MAPNSSTLVWKIPWMEEPGRLQSMGSLRDGHNWATSFSLLLSCIGEGNGNPFQCYCLENPRNRGAWRAAVYGVTQSRTLLTWLSSSSSFEIWLAEMELCCDCKMHVGFWRLKTKKIFLKRTPVPIWEGFPGDTDGKESTCNEGDLGLIPGLGRSPGEGNGNWL